MQLFARHSNFIFNRKWFKDHILNVEIEKFIVFRKIPAHFEFDGSYMFQKKLGQGQQKIGRVL